MQHLDASAVQFLERLGKSPEGRQLQALLELEVIETNEKLRKLSGDDLMRAQGKAIYLDEILAKLNPPPSQLLRRDPLKRPPISHEGFA